MQQNTNQKGKKIQISDITQLVKMFYAGHGTFFFVNARTGMQFNLKFKSSPGKRRDELLKYSSQVWVCFGVDNTSYVHLARYNFKFQLLQLRSETENWEHNKLRAFFDSFKYIRDVIISGNEFPNNIHVFYDGACTHCGKPLEHPESIQRGFGPECEKFFNQDIKDILQFKIPI